MSSSPLRPALLGGLVGGLVVAAAVAVLGLTGAVGDDDDEGPPIRTVAASPSIAPRAGDPVREVYGRASRAVVSVQRGGGSGSGFVIDGDGTIVTNAHVVGDAREVTVRFGEDGKRIEARVTGRDVSSDLAVLKIDPQDADTRLTVLALADSDRVRVGELAVAIGNPFRLPLTVTAGIVSAVGRQIDAPNGFSIPDAIQTDAAINPGNSGGPLLDEHGRVVGVNSQIETGGAGRGNVGVGFAVPSNTVREVVRDLADDGRVRRSYLGVSTAERASGGGVAIRQVVPDAPANDAGLRAGDVIVRIGTTRVDAPGDVTEAVLAREPGDRVAVTVQRDGERRTIEVRLGEQPRRAP
jgi:putative serine protease PepD